MASQDHLTHKAVWTLAECMAAAGVNGFVALDPLSRQELIEKLQNRIVQKLCLKIDSSHGWESLQTICRVFAETSRLALEEAMATEVEGLLRERA